SSDQNLDADILKLGHHGSDTSSTPEFIEAVDPDVGVMSVGNKNSYGHPSKSVIDRMTDRGVDLYSTKDHGTVIIKTDGNEYDITTKKTEMSRLLAVVEVNLTKQKRVKRNLLQKKLAIIVSILIQPRNQRFKELFI